MTVNDYIPEPVSRLADKIDAVLLHSSQWSDEERLLFVPAFAVMLGRFVAYESGGRERIPEGLDLIRQMLEASAALAVKEFYGEGRSV